MGVTILADVAGSPASNINLYLNVITLVALGVVGYYGMRSKVKNDNLKDLKDRVLILETERDEARLQHLENQKAIANLEGQLKTYKDIPLRRIDVSLAALADSNSRIVQILEASSIIAATDRDALLNPTGNQHIDTQTVDTQVIKKK